MITNNKLSLDYEFINIHHYRLNQLLSFDSGIAYALAAYKCNTKKSLLNLLTTLSNVVMEDSRKLAIKRIILYVFDDFFTADVKRDLIKKFEKGDDFDMKCSLDYVIEDIQRSMEKERLKGEKKGKHQGLFEIAKNMLQGGENLDKIMLYTGVSKAKLMKMKQEMEI